MKVYLLNCSRFNADNVRTYHAVMGVFESVETARKYLHDAALTFSKTHDLAQYELVRNEDRAVFKSRIPAVDSYSFTIYCRDVITD